MPESSSSFIVLESIDAAGGSTQAGLLAGRLEKAGYDVLTVHFPQEEKATGQLIYSKFLRNRNRLTLSRREQALLYIQDFFSRTADIAEHLRGGGKRAIVADRFYHSTLAYQTISLIGARRQRMIAWIKQLCEHGEPRLPEPNLIIFLDTPVAISAKHLRRRTADFFENQRKQTAIRKSYLHLAREEGWTIVSSADDKGEQRSTTDIHEEVWQHVKERIKE